MMMLLINIKQRYSLLPALALAIISAIFSTTIQGAEYEIEGTLIRTSYPKPVGSVSWTNNFRVAVKSNQWMIKYEFSPTYYGLGACDGSFTYELFYQAADQVFPEARKLGATGGCSASIDYAGIYPSNSLPIIKMLWLAFGSSSYFAGGTNHSMPPPWIPNGIVGTVAEAYERSYTFDLIQFDDSLRLPKHIDFVLSSNTFKALLEKIPIKPIARQAELQRLAGYTEYVVYDTGATTNYSGIIIPMEFSFERSFRSTRTNSALIRKTESITAAVSRISHLSQSNVNILLPHNIPISMFDPRFRDAKYPDLSLIYDFVTNAYWPPLSGADVTNRLKAARERADKDRKVLNPGGDYSGFFTFVLVAILFLPLVVLYFRRQKKHN